MLAGKLVEVKLMGKDITSFGGKRKCYVTNNKGVVADKKEHELLLKDP